MSAIRIHLRKQGRALCFIQRVAQFIYPAVCAVQGDVELVADLAGEHVVIDVDVEIIVVVERANVRPEYGIAVERDRDVEVQLIAVFGNLIIERDVVERQRGKGILCGHTQRKLRIARSGYERGVVPWRGKSRAPHRNHRVGRRSR